LDLVARFLEKKRRRVQEIAAAAERLRGELEALEQEETKVRLQIETAEEMAQEMRQGAPAKTSEKAGRSRRKRVERKSKPEAGGIALIEAIREIIGTLPAPFTTGAVRTELQARYPELANVTHHSSLAGTMRRMGVKKELEPIEKGGPGKEATYGPPKGGTVKT